MSDAVIRQLAAVLEQRRQASGEQSYVAGLYRAGTPTMLAKVREEAAECEEAARQVEAGEQPTARLVAEVADLWFHSLVLLHALGGDGGDILNELERRFGVSGLEEKASRTQDHTQDQD